MDRCSSYNNINKIKHGFEADLHEESLPVGVDDGHEGLHLPRHGHQLRDEARRALHRVLAVERGLVQIFLTPSNYIDTDLLGHGEAGDGGLQQQRSVQRGAEEQPGLLLQNLRHREHLVS